jgi:hypothetical protein
VLYNIIRDKGDTLNTVYMESFPPDMTSKRDLIGHRLDSRDTLRKCLASVHLSPGADEVRWYLHDQCTR